MKDEPVFIADRIGITASVESDKVLLQIYVPDGRRVNFAFTEEGLSALRGKIDQTLSAMKLKN